MGSRSCYSRIYSLGNVGREWWKAIAEGILHSMDETGIRTGGMEREMKICGQLTLSLTRVACRVPRNNCWYWEMLNEQEKNIWRAIYVWSTTDRAGVKGKRIEGSGNMEAVADSRLTCWGEFVGLDLEEQDDRWKSILLFFLGQSLFFFLYFLTL